MHQQDRIQHEPCCDCACSNDVIDRIKACEKERAYLLAALELWLQVQAQGISSDDVQSFGFDPKLLSGKDKRAYPGSFVERRKNGSYRTLMHNYVRLKDGSIKPLNPMLKAVRHYDDND